MELKTFSSFKTKLLTYRFFVQFPHWKQFDTGKIKDFSTIIKEFHKDLIKAVVTTRQGVELPLRMGKLMVISYRSNRSYPNFRMYRTGVITNYSNNHTDGLKCKLMYTNYERRYRVKDKYLWEFVPEAGFKKEISKAFVQNYNMYVNNPIRSISTLGSEYKLKDEIEARIAKFLLTYDEFAMN